MNPETTAAFVGIALAMYINEPCRICGTPLTEDDIKTAVFAGYSSCNRSRAAHKQCWDASISKENWSFPN